MGFKFTQLILAIVLSSALCLKAEITQEQKEALENAATRAQSLRNVVNILKTDSRDSQELMRYMLMLGNVIQEARDQAGRGDLSIEARILWSQLALNLTNQLDQDSLSRRPVPPRLERNQHAWASDEVRVLRRHIRDIATVHANPIAGSY